MAAVALRPGRRVRVADGRLIGRALGTPIAPTMGPWLLDEDDGLEVVYRVLTPDLDARKDSVKRSVQNCISHAERKPPLEEALRSHVLRVLVVCQGDGLLKFATGLATEWPQYKVVGERVEL
jgi:hypothetical protein